MVDDTSVIELDEKLVKLTGHSVPEFHDTEAGETTSCLFLRKARIKEGMSQLTETSLEFVSKDRELDIGTVLGRPMNIELLDEQEATVRVFHGTVTEIEYLGPFQKYALFTCQIRPWFWFLTKIVDCKVFQSLDTMGIVAEILSERGFGDFRIDVQGDLIEREYTIQYNESDYDFMCRLMEEDGIYFYFDDSDSGTNKLVFANDSGGHAAVPGGPAFDFTRRDEDNRRITEHIYDWSGADRVTSGVATYRDYEFTTSTAEVQGATTIERGEHSHKAYEVYRYPGHGKNADENDVRARMQAERNAVEHKLRRGASNIKLMAPGLTFKINDHPNGDDETEYLLITSTHEINIGGNSGDMDAENPLLENRIVFKNKGADVHRCVFTTSLKAEPYRPKPVTPWPRLPSMLTAVVVGPEGDEIHTDEYGRIKVQFHWDRVGEKNESSSCFIRTMMPWTGKDWGMIAIPRIGSEVVINFVNGNPDRPVCVGMLYNDQNMPPYSLDANKTMSGVKTRSTTGGNADTFHELVFEDLYESEYVRFQSERDYYQIVKNNAEITIGMEHQDEGSLTQTIFMNKTETIKEGDDTLTIETGNQIINIKTDQTETIEGKSDRTITGNVTETVEDGNHETTVSSGNKAETVSTGDYDISVSGGTLTIEAGIEICLKVGGNSITIDQSGVTVDGIAVAVSGTATLDAGSPMTTVSGDGILTLSGGLTKIN